MSRSLGGQQLDQGLGKPETLTTVSACHQNTAQTKIDSRVHLHLQETPFVFSLPSSSWRLQCRRCLTVFLSRAKATYPCPGCVFKGASNNIIFACTPSSTCAAWSIQVSPCALLLHPLFNLCCMVCSGVTQRITAPHTAWRKTSRHIA